MIDVFCRTKHITKMPIHECREGERVKERARETEREREREIKRERERERERERGIKRANSNSSFREPHLRSEHVCNAVHGALQHQPPHQETEEHHVGEQRAEVHHLEGETTSKHKLLVNWLESPNPIPISSRPVPYLP